MPSENYFYFVDINDTDFKANHFSNTILAK